MFDSLVIDLIFQHGASFAPELLVKALGGEETAGNRKILDPDLQGPQFEMELSPSMPFRRRGERRLLIIDDSVAPMRADPRRDAIVPLDLTAERELLISLCQSFEIKLGRIFALGSWGDAVMVAHSARELRGMALLSWVLDPTVDVDGKQRGSRLTQQEFETKLEAYDKRLDELDENEILAELSSARIERRGDYLVVDVLEEDGTWDVRKSLELEHQLAAVERFSLIPGAPASKRRPASAQQPAGGRAEPASAPEQPKHPLSAVDLAGEVLLVFPPERFDLDVAAALGKKDYGAVLHASDPIPGAMRDLIYRQGAHFLAPLEFFSEVFLDGKPLSRPQFDAHAAAVGERARAMEVHCPRYGRVALLVTDSGGRFITSALHALEQVIAALPGS